MMTLIWDTPDLSPVDKLALLALADWANDDGVAWPSISQIANKTGCGERTVQRAFRKAEEIGLLTRDEVKGKGCNYRLHPRHAGTPATEAPPPHRRVTPATVAPNTLEHTIIDKAKALPIARAKPANEYPKPEWADPIVWADFLKNRKKKNKPNTATAYKRFCDDIARLSSDEWPPGRLLAYAASEGWAGIYEPRDEKDKQNGTGRTQQRSTADLGRDVAAQLEREAAANRSGGHAHAMLGASPSGGF